MDRRLDPEAAKILRERLALNLPPLSQWTPTFARSLSVPDSVEIPKRFKKISLPTNHGPITFHVHLPSGSGPFPLILFFHGGGFVIGIEDYFSTLQKLAEHIPSIIVAPKYRLAPEHKFPVGIEDAHSAFEAVVRGLDLEKNYRSKIIVAGDSAGGNLAANVILNSKRRDHIAGQILIYPWLDLSLSGNSYAEFSSGFGLTREKLVWYRGHYLPGEITKFDEPKISPLFADVKKQPPTFIATAEFDVVRDDGERYARKLESTGNSVGLKRYDGMIHGFFEHTERLKAANDLFNDLKRFISGMDFCS